MAASQFVVGWFPIIKLTEEGGSLELQARGIGAHKIAQPKIWASLYKGLVVRRLFSFSLIYKGSLMSNHEKSRNTFTKPQLKEG